jgi:hypothetical protein
MCSSNRYRIFWIKIMGVNSITDSTAMVLNLCYEILHYRVYLPNEILISRLLHLRFPVEAAIYQNLYLRRLDLTVRTMP